MPPDQPDRYVGMWVPRSASDPLSTVGRHPGQDLDRIAEVIANAVELAPTDSLLDLCCGSGLLTGRLAARCRQVIGVDHSVINIRIARQQSYRPSCSFKVCDAMCVADVLEGQKFDVVLCYFALQYFHLEHARVLIRNARDLLRQGGVIFLGDIPDIDRRWAYYHGVQGRIKYRIKRMMRWAFRLPGQDSIGWWWRPDDLSSIAREIGLNCLVLQQPLDLPHAHYRFDCVMHGDARVGLLGAALR